MKNVCIGGMVPHVTGRNIIRSGRMGLGRRVFMPPFMPWQRQMGALLMSDL